MTGIVARSSPSFQKFLHLMSLPSFRQLSLFPPRPKSFLDFSLRPTRRFSPAGKNPLIPPFLFVLPFPLSGASPSFLAPPGYNSRGTSLLLTLWSSFWSSFHLVISLLSPVFRFFLPTRNELNPTFENQWHVPLLTQRQDLPSRDCPSTPQSLSI